MNIAGPIVGVVGLAVFALLGTLVAVAGARIYALSATLNALQYRHMAYAFTLAWMYLVVGPSTLEYTRQPSGQRVNVGFVLLDGLVWAVAIVELLHLTSAAPSHLRQLGTLQLPARSEFTKLNARLATLCVAALTAGAFVSESTRYVVLAAAGPLCALVAAHVYTNQEWHPRPVRVNYALLAMVGGAALLLALLGPAYTGVLNASVSIIGMLCTHTALYCGLLALAATSVRTGALEGMAFTPHPVDEEHDGASVHHDIDLPAAFMRE